MRRVLGVALTGIVMVSVFAVGPAAGTSSGGDAPGSCSRATAKSLIRENPHLHPWAPIYEAPGAVLCGSFLGKGSNALVMSFAAATCGGSSGWAAFRRKGNEWKLVWKYRNGQRSIAAAGTDIRETLNILRPGDPRCVPTGGTKARTWHWNGSRFVAGRWSYHYVNPAEFLSPDRKVWCVIGEGRDVFCAAGGSDPANEPQSSARFDRNGRVTLCSVAHASLREACFVNWGSTAPVLRYGEESKLDGIRCTSAANGITCVKLTDPGKGNGFRVNKDEAVRLAPGDGAARSSSAPEGERTGRQLAKSATSRAHLWSALDGKVICGLAIHAPGAPAELLCAARSVPAPRRAPSAEGDPGFVFLRSVGHPRLARLSQYSWEVEGGWESRHRPELQAGQRWSSGAIETTCSVRAHAVRCANASRHGFTIKIGSYRAF